VAWSWLQSVSADNAGGTGLTVTTAAFGSNLTSGTKLIAYVSAAQVPSACTISTVKLNDTAVSAFSQVLAYTTNTSEHVWIYVLDMPADAVGTRPTVTATFTGSQNGSAILVQEVSGLATGSTAAAVLDGTAGTANGSGNIAWTATWGAYTSAVANEFLTGLYADDGDGTGSTNGTPTGYTADTHNLSSDSNNDLRVYYKSTVGGSETIASLSVSGSGTYDWNTVFVAFKLAAAAAAASGTSQPQPIPPGLQSPMTLAEPARFSVPPAPRQPPAPAPLPIPPGLQSPMTLAVPPRPATSAAPPLQPPAPAPSPVPPGLQSPMSLAEPARFSVPPAPAEPPAPAPAPVPPGLQSPMTLAVPLYPATQAPPPIPPAPPAQPPIPPGLQSPMALAVPARFAIPPPPQQPPAPAPLPIPPGLQSPMTLAVPATPATSAAPVVVPPGVASPPTLPIPPGLQSPMSLAVPARPAAQPPPVVAPPGVSIPAPLLVPPGLQSPMSLAVPARPATQAPPAPPPPAQPGTAQLTPPGLQSPMALGLPLYQPPLGAPPPGPLPPTPPIPSGVVFGGQAAGGDRDPEIRVMRAILPTDVQAAGAARPEMRGRGYVGLPPERAEDVAHTWESPPEPEPPPGPTLLDKARDKATDAGHFAYDLGRIFADPPYDPRAPKPCGALHLVGGVALHCRLKPHPPEVLHYDRGLYWRLW
jgi:hypothetical protein